VAWYYCVHSINKKTRPKVTQLIMNGEIMIRPKSSKILVKGGIVLFYPTCLTLFPREMSLPRCPWFGGGAKHSTCSSRPQRWAGASGMMENTATPP
jgi:hypothetical protein